jgi:hypothetical protein
MAIAVWDAIQPIGFNATIEYIQGVTQHCKISLISPTQNFQLSVRLAIQA